MLIDFIINLGCAVFFGALIGTERQWRQRMAGLRTNALVCAGASLFVLLSQRIPTNGDQSRIASYVVSGVGFLGAGVIMKDGASVRGINTAATLWCSAAVGCLAGFGLRIEAAIATAAVLGMHLLLRPAAKIINRQPIAPADLDLRYQVRIVCKEDAENHVRYLILQAVGLTTLSLQSIQSVDLTGSAGQVEIIAELESASRQDQIIEQTVSRLGLERGISAVAWKIMKFMEVSS